MPYTPPTARAAIASRPDTKFLSCSCSYSKSQRRDNSISDHGSRMEIPSLLSSRACPITFCKSTSISKPPSFILGRSMPGTLAFEMSSSDSDDAQKNEISPTLSPPITTKDEATTRRGRLREKPDPHQLQTGNKMKTTQAYLGVPSPPRTPSDKEITLKSELSPSVSLPGDARKNVQSSPDAGTNACPAFPRNKSASRARNTRESQRSDSEDDKLRRKPTLVHKKSGEIVPSALRASSRMRRHSSLPGTPVCPKAVHFRKNGLEHTRFFLRGERPTAVSAGSSPVASHQNESCFLFENDEWRSPSPPFKWEMLLSHFPHQSFERTLLPVRVESVYLSSDTKVLMGVVAVSNLAFYKSVVIRFTFDHWKTTSEVAAEFDHDSVESQTKDGCDRFVFKIKLEDQTHLEEKTMFFCVRYNVNLQEYWDNNNLINYQVNFSKRTGVQHEICERPRVTQIQSSVDAGIRITNGKANQLVTPDHPESITVTKKNPLLWSHSYRELLDKYCFFGNENLSSHAAKAAPRQSAVPG